MTDHSGINENCLSKFSLRAQWRHLFVLERAVGAHYYAVGSYTGPTHLPALCSVPLPQHYYSKTKKAQPGFIPFCAFRRKEWTIIMEVKHVHI